VLFRYYDPRVLEVFLPACSAAQRKEFFGPVQHFYAESDAGKSVLRYSVDADLRSAVLP
jgi:hypothetical protein